MRRSALAGAHAPPHATVKDNAHPATWVAAAREHIGTAVLSDQISRDIWPNPGRPVTNKPMTSTVQRAISEHVVQRTSKGQRTADRLLDTAELLFAQKGYVSKFIYGGYGYFDNMNYFFGHSGYQIADRQAISDAGIKIHYENIWGVADEDLFTLVLKEAGDVYQQGKPFFFHM